MTTDRSLRLAALGMGIVLFLAALAGGPATLGTLIDDEAANAAFAADDQGTAVGDEQTNPCVGDGCETVEDDGASTSSMESTETPTESSSPTPSPTATPNATETPTPSPTPEPTPTPTETPTPTPSPTPTPESTSTPEPTPTPTQTPEPTETSDGDG